MLTRRDVLMELKRMGVGKPSLLKSYLRDFEKYIGKHYSFEISKTKKSLDRPSSQVSESPQNKPIYSWLSHRKPLFGLLRLLSYWVYWVIRTKKPISRKSIGLLSYWVLTQATQVTQATQWTELTQATQLTQVTQLSWCFQILEPLNPRPLEPLCLGSLSFALCSMLALRSHYLDVGRALGVFFGGRETIYYFLAEPNQEKRENHFHL